jgi:hypothetical protein
VVIGLVALLVLLGGLFLWWSESVRRHANETLSVALQSASRDATAGQARVLSTLAYSYPMIWSMSVSDEVRSGLREVVQASSVDVADGLRQVRDQAAEVRVLPWQQSQRQAQQEVLAVIDAYAERFDRMGADATAIGVVLSEPDPSDAAARDSLRASGAEASSDR